MNHGWCCLGVDQEGSGNASCCQAKGDGRWQQKDDEEDNDHVQEIEDSDEEMYEPPPPRAGRPNHGHAENDKIDCALNVMMMSLKMDLKWGKSCSGTMVVLFELWMMLSWHRYIADVIDIIPIKGKATVFGACPVFADDV